MSGIYIVIQEYDFVEKGTTTIRSLLPGSIGQVNPSDSMEYLFDGFAIDRSVVLANPTYFSALQDQSFWSPPVDGTPVWLVSAGGVISTDTFDSVNPSHVQAYATGDVHVTLADATAKVQQRYLAQRLREMAEGLNMGWVPDWGNADQTKYYIGFRYGVAEVLSTTLLHVPGVTYFRSQAAAEQAIGLLGPLLTQLSEAWGGGLSSSSATC